MMAAPEGFELSRARRHARVDSLGAAAIMEIWLRRRRHGLG
jgi:hypothetical protein